MTDYCEIEYQYHLILTFCLHTDLQEYSKLEAQQIYCVVLQLYRIQENLPSLSRPFSPTMVTRGEDEKIAQAMIKARIGV